MEAYMSETVEIHDIIWIYVSVMHSGFIRQLEEDEGLATQIRASKWKPLLLVTLYGSVGSRQKVGDLISYYQHGYGNEMCLVAVALREQGLDPRSQCRNIKKLLVIEPPVWCEETVPRGQKRNKGPGAGRNSRDVNRWLDSSADFNSSGSSPRSDAGVRHGHNDRHNPRTDRNDFPETVTEFTGLITSARAWSNLQSSRTDVIKLVKEAYTVDVTTMRLNRGKCVVLVNGDTDRVGEARRLLKKELGPFDRSEPEEIVQTANGALVPIFVGREHQKGSSSQQKRQPGNRRPTQRNPGADTDMRTYASYSIGKTTSGHVSFNTAAASSTPNSALVIPVNSKLRPVTDVSCTRASYTRQVARSLESWLGRQPEGRAQPGHVVVSDGTAEMYGKVLHAVIPQWGRFAVHDKSACTKMLNKVIVTCLQTVDEQKRSHVWLPVGDDGWNGIPIEHVVKEIVGAMLASVPNLQHLKHIILTADNHKTLSRIHELFESETQYSSQVKSAEKRLKWAA